MTERKTDEALAAWNALADEIEAVWAEFNRQGRRGETIDYALRIANSTWRRQDIMGELAYRIDCEALIRRHTRELTKNVRSLKAALARERPLKQSRERPSDLRCLDFRLHWPIAASPGRASSSTTEERTSDG
jgi:hypothetical protein